THGAAKAMGFVITDEAIDQNAPCHQLHLGIKRAANRKAAFVELFLSVTLAEYTPDFFRKIAGGESVGREDPGIDTEWLGLGFIAILARDGTVFDHPVDDPVAPIDRPFAF